MGAAAIISISRDGQLLKELPIEGGESVLGRGQECAIRLEDRAVSRRHAVLRLVEQGLQIENKSEFGPISVNGSECTRAILKSGDLLSVGPFVLELKWDTSPNTSQSLSTAPPLQPAEFAAPLESFDFDSPPVDLAPKPVAVEFSETSGALEPAPGIELSNAVSELEQPPEFSQELPKEEASPIGTSLEISEPPTESPIEENAESNIQGGIHLEPPENAAPVEAAFDVGPLEINTGAEVPEDGVTQVLEKSSTHARLVIPAGIANVESFEIQNVDVFIGRGSECQIQISDKKSSRKHVSIQRSGNSFLLKDLGSANGTAVNGVRLREKILAGGDVIRIGDTEIQFEAFSVDYEQKKQDFLNVPEETTQDLEGAEFQEAPPLPLDPIPQGPSPEAVGFAPVEPQLGSEPRGIWERWKALPPRTRLIRGLSSIVLIYMLLDYIPMGDTKAPRKVKGKAQTAQVQKEEGPGDRNFETLSPEQKKFVESQHQLAFEYYRNKEYDRSLFEVQKIFQLIPDYKDSREIERYAKEGKRKLDAQEEEQKRAEEEARLKAKVAQYVQEARKMMDSGNFVQAMQIFPQILALEPENETVSKWQHQIAEAEEQKRLEEERARVQNELDSSARKILSKAEDFKRNGKCPEALVEYRKVGATGTSNRKLLVQVENGVQDCLVTIQATIGPLLADANQAEGEGNTAKAYKLYERVLEMDLENPVAKDAMLRIQDQIHEQAKYAYTEAVVAESYSDYETARKKYQYCMEISPKGDVYYERAKRRLARFMPLEQVEGATP